MQVSRKNVLLVLAMSVTVYFVTAQSAPAVVIDQEFRSHLDVGIGPIPPGTDVFSTITDLSSTDAAQGIVPTVRLGPGATFGSEAFLTNGEWTSDDGATDGAIYFDPINLIQIDLGALTPILEINVFSRHPGTRLRQIYDVYGAADAIAPSVSFYPSLAFWTLIASVDSGFGTNNADGVLVTSVHDSIGSFQFLIFDLKDPELFDPGVQGAKATNFVEIDVHAINGATIPEPSTLHPRPLKGLA